jgi:hypothetical protein
MLAVRTYSVARNRSQPSLEKIPQGYPISKLFSAKCREGESSYWVPLRRLPFLAGFPELGATISPSDYNFSPLINLF